MLALASAPVSSPVPDVVAPVLAHVRSTRLDDLSAVSGAWDRLAAETVRPTPYYTRHVLDAHREAGLLGRVAAVAVARQDRLLALLPYRRHGAWLGLSGLANTAWTSPFTTSSNPLVSREETAIAVPLLLDGMAALPGRLWLLPSLSLDGLVGQAFRLELGRRGWPSAVLDRFERAVLDAKLDHDRFLAGLDSSRRKDLRRRRRRLEEMGAVLFTSAVDGPALERGVDAFLTLERAGWKGRGGTALASRPATAVLARALFGRQGGGVAPRSDLLTLDGRPIAASLSLVCGGSAFLLKSAYDETLSRLAPGLLLEEEIVRSLHETRFADRLDSAAAPGSHMEALYPDREAVGDLVLATSDAFSQARLARVVAHETTRRAWLRKGKSLARRLKADGWRTLHRSG